MPLLPSDIVASNQLQTITIGVLINEINPINIIGHYAYWSYWHIFKSYYIFDQFKISIKKS